MQTSASCLHAEVCGSGERNKFGKTVVTGEEEIVSFLLLLFILLLGPSEMGGTGGITFPLFSLFP